jgi:limonene-1,2-epoxide hydrolase
MTQSPEAIVRAFCAAWNAKDIETILAMLTEDCIYANIPLPAMHGRDAVRKFVTPNLTKSDGIDFIFLNIATAADGKTVLTERVDVFVFGDKKVECPVMGTFVLRGDLIAEWRDYADIGSFVQNMRAIGQAPGPGVTS